MSVVDAWLGPMSTTVREQYEVGDLDPSAVLEAAAAAERDCRAAFRKLELAAHWADLHPATPDTGVETFGGAALLADESLGGGRHPAGGGVHPGTVRPRAGLVAVGRGTADRRRPRPAPPPPDAVETRCRGWRCPPGRPDASPARPTASPRPARSGSTNSSPTAAPAAPSSSTGSSPTPSPRTTPRHTRTGRTTPRLAGTSRSPTPRPTDFLGTSHLEATGDTLTLKTFYDHRLCDRPPAVPRRRHQPARRPQDQGPRHPHRPTPDLEQREDQGLRAGRGPRPRTRRPRRRRDREARRRHPHQDPHLGRPPPGRHPTRPQHGPPRRRRLPRPTSWMRDLVMLRDGHCIFPRCQVDARSCDLDHTIPYDEDGPPGQTTARQPRRPVPATPPRQDHRSLAIPPHARRRLPLARPVRHDVPRHPRSTRRLP